MPNHEANHPRVVVLMATYNGARFLGEQLNSLARQSIPHLDLVVSDDGSTDGTVELLRTAAQDWSKGTFLNVAGPGRGFAENFRFLLTTYGKDHDYIAFADQDDIWDADKLEIALEWLQQRSHDAAVYFSRTRYVDDKGRYLRMSPLFKKAPSVRNALVQSIGGGNTMVMNRAAAALVIQASINKPFISHDWWAYIVVSACGGEVYYDPTPHMDYRQHNSNLVGANDSTTALLKRFVALQEGRFKRWTDTNLAGLAEIDDLLTDEARSLVNELRQLRNKGPIGRLSQRFRSGFYRQTHKGELGLTMAAAMGWI